MSEFIIDDFDYLGLKRRLAGNMHAAGIELWEMDDDGMIHDAMNGMEDEVLDALLRNDLVRLGDVFLLYIYSHKLHRGNDGVLHSSFTVWRVDLSQPMPSITFESMVPDSSLKRFDFFAAARGCYHYYQGDGDE